MPLVFPPQQYPKQHYQNKSNMLFCTQLPYGIVKNVIARREATWQSLP